MEVALGLGLFLFGCGIGALVTRIFYRSLIRACFAATPRSGEDSCSTEALAGEEF